MVAFGAAVAMGLGAGTSVKATKSVLFAMTQLHCVDGIANQLATLIEHLHCRGWSCHFASGEIDCPSEAAETLRRLKEACTSFVHDSRLWCANRLTPLTVVRQYRALRNHRERTGCGIIHLRGRALGPAATILRAVKSVPVVNVPPLAPERDLSPTRQFVMKSLGWTLGQHVVAISKEMTRVLQEEWGVSPDRISHVPHGVDLRRFVLAEGKARQSARTTLGIPNSAFAFVQVARVAPIKRPEDILCSLSALRQQDRDVYAALIGTCGDGVRRRLMDIAGSLGVKDRIVICGHQDPAPLLAAFDAAVLASEREGFATSIVEAMACGIPVLRTPTEGSLDQIDIGRSGFLFPIGDVSGLAKQLAWLMDHPAERKQMASFARRVALTRFSADSMTSQMISIYESLIAGTEPE